MTVLAPITDSSWMGTLEESMNHWAFIHPDTIAFFVSPVQFRRYVMELGGHAGRSEVLLGVARGAIGYPVVRDDAIPNVQLGRDLEGIYALRGSYDQS